jgi:hypothetical protein
MLASSFDFSFINFSISVELNKLKLLNETNTNKNFITLKTISVQAEKIRPSLLALTDGSLVILPRIIPNLGSFKKNFNSNCFEPIRISRNDCLTLPTF